jgi:hypothetical protein
MKYSLFAIVLSYVASPKFCLHCTHFIPDKIGNQFSTCNFFPDTHTDTSFLVTGEKKEVEDIYHYCSTARKYDHMCGEYAKHYFPKILDIEIEPTGGNGGDWDDDFSGIIDSVFS